MNNGWIKLHRKLLENEIFKHDPTAWHIFEVLLIICDRNDGKWSGGRKQLAELSGINENTLKDAIKRLISQQMVTSSSTTKYTKYYICNWKQYQDNDTSLDTQTAPKRHPNDTTLTRSKELRIKKNTNVLAKAEYGKPEINELFNYWQETVGFKISSKIQQNRNACNNLLKKHGQKVLEQLIRGVNATSSDKYAPRISDFVELQAKTNELITWGKKSSNNKIGVKL